MFLFLSLNITQLLFSLLNDLTLKELLYTKYFVLSYSIDVVSTISYHPIHVFINLFISVHKWK